MIYGSVKLLVQYTKENEKNKLVIHRLYSMTNKQFQGDQAFLTNLRMG